jgi:hypothetical protein
MQKLHLSQPFTTLLHSIIREYATYCHGSYSVKIEKIMPSDMRLLLSYIVDSEDYEKCSTDYSYLLALFEENKKFIEEQIDEQSHVVYCEDMEEMGMQMLRHPNNDECYWIRR